MSCWRHPAPADSLDARTLSSIGPKTAGRTRRCGARTAKRRRPAASSWSDDQISADEAYGLGLPGHRTAVAGGLPERTPVADRAGQSRRPALARTENRRRCGACGPRRRLSSLSPGTGTAGAHAGRAVDRTRCGLPRGIAPCAGCAPGLRGCLRSAQGPSVVSLRTLLGLIGAHEWRTKGIEIAALDGRIHPHYGVFAPIRSEYVDLVATRRCRS